MNKILLFLILNLIILNISATKYYVSTRGSNSKNDGSKDNPWATVNYAISQANNHDTINIGVGTFTEKNILIDRSLTINGVNSAYSIIQAEHTKTEINGNVIFDIHADVSISNLTLRHGSPAISIGESASLNILYSNIIDCISETPGGAINAAGDMVMTSCCVANNSCTGSGGGIFASANTKIFNTTISNNHSTGTNTFGGGILINNGSLELKNSTVVYNSATAKGKGIHVNSNTALVNVFYNNIVAANGIPDVGSNYAPSFPVSENIDYNSISFGWSGYLNFGKNSDINNNSDEVAIQDFIDSLALQSLNNAGNGVLVHAINQQSYLAIDKGGSSSTPKDIRNATRIDPDRGAYEFISDAPMTSLTIQNIDTTIHLNEPVRVATLVNPAYTGEEILIEIDNASEAQAYINGDSIIATTEGMLKIRARHMSNSAINDYIIFNVIEKIITIESIGINLSNSHYNYVLSGEQVQLNTNVIPNSGIDTTVTWGVSSEQFATISKTGLLTAISPGTVTVTATSNFDTNFFESIEINIIDDFPVNFDIKKDIIYKTGIENPCGAVLCWLTDSDIERPRNRSMESALSEMKAGALRFPYGALSNNYLWTKNPADLGNGLQPSVAVSSRGPGNWDWAVDTNGYFKKDMDFDEYVSLCRNIGAEPVVCVNIMSHVYDNSDDITIDTLIYYAKEWVRYANITKGYGIKYWQLGNEQDHHGDIYPLNEFKTDYKRMSAAMQAIDPDIKTAPGLLQKWNSEMLYYCPEYVNFITCHQYLFFGGSETEGYSAWKNYGSDLVRNIKKNQDILTSSNSKLEIFVTETGITGGKYPDPQIFNLYKALILFEMQMEQIILPNVRNTFYWGTHTPWNGEFGDSPIATLFSNDDANENHLQADILNAINSNIQSKHLGRKSKNGVVSWFTISDDDSVLVAFVLNKNSFSKKFNYSVDNLGTVKNFEKWILQGTSEFDENVEFKFETKNMADEDSVKTILPPLSISILKTKLNKTAVNVLPFSGIKNDLNIYPNPVKDNLHISFGKENFDNASISIININGKVKKIADINNSRSIDVSDLSSGFYIIKIKTEDRISTQAFIKK